MLDRLKNGLSNVWRKIWRLRPLEKDVMETKLHRCMTTLDLVLLGLGHMVGSGIYVVTGVVVLQQAGPSTFISYLLAGIVSLLMALCYAQFSVNIPRAGTSFLYIYTTGGELAAFLAGWNMMLEYIIMTAALGRSLSAYLNGLTQGALNNATHQLIHQDDPSSFFYHFDLVGPAAILVLYLIVAVGIKQTVYVNNIMVTLNIVVILTVIITGFSFGNVENLTNGPRGFMPYGLHGILTGVGILFYAYLGFDAIATAAEETKNPSRSLPIALCVSISIAIFLYCFAALALSFLVPYNKVNLDAPFLYAFESFHLTWVKYFVSAGATLGITCCLLGVCYTLSRTMYAFSRDGFLFYAVMYINQWTKTPLITIMVSAILGALLAMFLTLSSLVDMISIGALFSVALMIISLINLHYVPAKDCPFKLEQTSENLKSKTDEENEEIPILHQKKYQQLAKIGSLRYPVPILKDIDNYKVIKVAITGLCLSFLILTSSIMVGMPELLLGRWWAIVLVATSVFTSIVCFSLLLLLYEHNTSFTNFKVPLFPWVPVIALFSTLLMMMALEWITWVRLIVWLVIGIIFYFVYVIRHSLAAKREQEGERLLQDIPSASSSSSSS